MAEPLNCARSSVFFGPSLAAAPAVAAILFLSDGQIVMQLRDDIPAIFYPNHWGCFGGAVELGETHQEALRRELAEELALTLPDGELTPFTTFTFDFGFAGRGIIERTYFVIVLEQFNLDGFVLGEGAAVEAFTVADLLENRRIVPYDAFAIWMEVSRTRLSGP